MVQMNKGLIIIITTLQSQGVKAILVQQCSIRKEGFTILSALSTSSYTNDDNNDALACFSHTTEPGFCDQLWLHNVLI